MLRSFIHNYVSSFTLWFEHTLLQQGQAFNNISGNLYLSNDTNYPNYTTFQGPFKQLVYDYSISGANVPSGVYVNDNFVPRGLSGLHLDYKNGRAIFETGNSAWNVTANYSVKEFNIYRTSKSDEQLIFSTSYILNPEFGPTNTGISPSDIIAPAIFIKLNKMYNDPFAIGGLDESEINIRAVILSDSEYNLDAVGSLFSDKVRDNFAIFPITPINEWGDLKTGYYNYNDYVSEYFSYSNLGYLKQINYSKLLDVVDKNINPDVQVGFIDFQTSIVRIT